MKDETKHQTLKFLKEVYNVAEITSTFSMSKIVSKHKQSKTITQILQDAKILKKNGLKGRGVQWYWITPVKPNIKMAEKVLENVNEKARISTINSRQKKKHQPITPIKTEKVNQPREKKESTIKEVSILWGLFKKTIKKNK